MADTANLTKENGRMSGLELAKKLYTEVYRPEMERRFPEYVDRIAAGLFGRGSDCYGFDDELSRDHDWGPGFQVYITRELYSAIGNELEEMYNSLPKKYMGYQLARTVSTHKRRGVFIIEDFFANLLGVWPITEKDYYLVEDSSLSEAVNGWIFDDPAGIVTKIRDDLMKGFPESVLYKKIAQSASRYAQCAQYNFKRVSERKDELTAAIMLSDGIKEAMKLAHYIDGQYPPHDKWLFKSCSKLSFADEVIPLLEGVMKRECNPDDLGSFFAHKMYILGFISDTDDYLDHHAQELLIKSGLVSLEKKELVDKVVRLEFEAFDKVRNEGGRASCQDDFLTFSIMRKSQYNTWDKQMLVQYLYDFEVELQKGHNLITEKYGRMMESTAHERYEEIKHNFPKISDEKKQIIEAIVSMQMAMTEAFYKDHPELLPKVRSIYTEEDSAYNTSNETYLRGEISTYSDKMLELYGRFIVAFASQGRNLTEEIIKNTIDLN